MTKKLATTIFLITTTLLLSLSLFILLTPYSTKSTIVKNTRVETQLATAPIIATSPSIIKTADDLIDLKLPILMYHHVRDKDDPKDSPGNFLTATTKQFSQQLDYLQKTGFTPVTFQELEQGIMPKKPIILTFDDSYIDFYKFAYPELKKRGLSAIIYVITGKLNTDKFMTSDEILELSKDKNIEIGSHTVTHPIYKINLRTLNDDDLKKELVDSKNYLEKLTGIPVISFSYPAGKYNLRVRLAVKNSGYTFSVTVNPGYASFKEPLDLNRYQISKGVDISKFLK